MAVLCFGTPDAEHGATRLADQVWRPPMTKLNDFTRTLAALACTLVFSTACVLGAVGPASGGAPQVAVQAQA